MVVAQKSRHSWEFYPPVSVIAGAGVVGPKESEGPLGGQFDYVFPDLRLGQKSFERAEQMMQQKAADLVLQKAMLTAEDVDLLFAGDLLNQITASCFTARGMGGAFLWSLFRLCHVNGSVVLGGVGRRSGAAARCLVVTGSHTCTAERQFRYPNEYGCQKPPYCQQTATAAGAALVGFGTGTGVQILGATLGRVVDEKITDPFQLNAAMAPAFADTVAEHLHAFGRRVEDYDLIFSGDLSRPGVALAEDLLARRGITLPPEKHQDCGLLLYGQTDSVFAGGSGCGCMASVGFGPVLASLQRGELRRVLLVATGALLSPQANQQGETIPGIAHCVELKGGGLCD